MIEPAGPIACQHLIALALGVWGAIVSTILAGLRIWQAWRGRFQIHIGPNLNSSPDDGNTIWIRNLSDGPVLLTYWILERYSGRWPFRKKTMIESPEEESVERTIGPGASIPLVFEGPRHFLWGEEALQGAKIYLRLYFFSRRRRAVLRKVCG